MLPIKREPPSTKNKIRTLLPFSSLKTALALWLPYYETERGDARPAAGTLPRGAGQPRSVRHAAGDAAAPTNSGSIDLDLLRQVMRLPYLHGIWLRFPIGSVENKVKYGVYAYAQYAYGVYWAAFLAKQLGMPRMTAVEFGVAGGRGLLALEHMSLAIGAHLGVEIDIVGFDSGEGMPTPADYRDLPHIWNVGFL